MGAPFLGEIALVPLIRESSDDGEPVMATKPDSPEALSFLAVAEKVAAALQGETHHTPNIIFE
jgi:ATP-binding protein involved in chromosome partitioning